ncbi:hypothetical protein C2845_PM15G10420 [Panicum miliaceum]|uniref:Uncharacterized protein n=1 Tax=Panicum miliaceum TaxID=4540 RepID=A0A3L6Q474_PANMI|nr:hypothetical protein C2845_PM15G10420 [Panicum miliaceum]
MLWWHGISPTSAVQPRKPSWHHNNRSYATVYLPWMPSFSSSSLSRYTHTHSSCHAPLYAQGSTRCSQTGEGEGAKKNYGLCSLGEPGSETESKKMASMISGDFAEAYVRKNACKEEERRAEANAAADGGSAAKGEKKAGGGASGKKTAAEEAGGKGDGGGLLGLIRKKVHPKAASS